MTIQLQRFRATLIWAWAGEELLAGRAGAWWAADRAQYVQLFNQLQAAGPTPWPLTLPWLPRRQRFFSYLASDAGQEPTHQSKLTGNAAYRHLVPLRATGLLPGLSTSLGGTVALQALLSPTGAGLLLNLDMRGDWPLDQAADHLLQALRGPVYTSDAATGVAARELLNQARQALQAHWGMPAVAQPYGAEEPCVVVTALRADGAEPLPPQGPEPDVHRALYALASGLRDWRTAPLPAWLARVNTPSTRHGTGGACLSAARRGVLVWHPDAMAPDAALAKTASLHCYHRNLCLALLHTQCAMHHLRLCRELRSGPGLSVQAADVLHRAVVVLSRLYGRAAYNTGAVRRWLAEDGDALDLLNEERLRDGMPAIA